MRDNQIRRMGLLSAVGALIGSIGGCASHTHGGANCEPSGQHANAAAKCENKLANPGGDDEKQRQNAVEPQSAQTTGEPTAATVPPSLGELPNLKPLTRRSIAARVDVEGSERTSKRRIVPEYKEIELSAEEKKALGKDKPARPDDVLAFYKSAPNPDKGASIADSDLRIGVGGHGGAIVGKSSPSTPAYAFGEGGKYAGNFGAKREGASVYDDKDVRWFVSFPWPPRIGHGPRRTGAEQIPYEER